MSPAVAPSAAAGPRPRELSPQEIALLRKGEKGVRPGRVAVQVFLVVMGLLWIFPVAWAVLNSFRDYDYTSTRGYVSLGGWTFGNYTEAVERNPDFLRFFLNSAIVTVPSVIFTLFLASMVAFVLARFSWKFNLIMLALFTAGNLLPQQAMLIPLYRMSLRVPLPEWMSDSGLLYDSYWALILVNTAFQTGFCTFVLSNYMKALPFEMYEAAMVDGASVWRQYWQITLPLCRPALAALATLEVTWIYNEFYWATVLLRTGSKFPVTSALNNLRGEFFSDLNLVAAGSVMVAIPTLVVFFALQKHFVAGLTLGANKG